jgi:hypothetical protein
MFEKIPGGGFTIARQIFYSKIWMKDPLYLKIWVWIIGRASYENHEKNGKYYKRGQFVTTYDEIIRSNSHYHNRRHIIPTLKQIRIILAWLQSEGMILVKQLKSEPCRTGPDSGARTRAYVGLKITVRNYNIYQDHKSYTGADSGAETCSELGHDNNKGTIKVKITPDIFSLKKRYSDQKLIDQVFAAIASTRKSNRVADSVLLAQLQKWERYPVEQVESGIRIYIDKGYADQGKREEYLFGIIRNQKIELSKDSGTGSTLLDSYYATNAN